MLDLSSTRASIYLLIYHCQWASDRTLSPMLVSMVGRRSDFRQLLCSDYTYKYRIYYFVTDSHVQKISKSSLHVVNPQRRALSAAQNRARPCELYSKETMLFSSFAIVRSSALSVLFIVTLYISTIASSKVRIDPPVHKRYLLRFTRTTSHPSTF